MSDDDVKFMVMLIERMANCKFIYDMQETKNSIIARVAQQAEARNLKSL